MGRNITTGSAGTDTTTTIDDAGRIRRRHRRRVAAVVGLAALAATACGGDDDSASMTAATATEAQDGAIGGDPQESGGDASTGDVSNADADDAAAPTGGAAEAGLPIDDFGRDIIRNVGLTMTTNNVAETSEAIRQIVAGNGGAVFGSDVSIGDEEDDGSVPGGGQIVVRVPPADLDQLVTELDGAGFVTRLSQDSQDVTDRLVDLDIRIRQAQTGIERIEVLLAQATELDDVFAIETELTNRQVEYEQLRAAERNTEDLVALATLTIDIEYRAAESLEEIVEPSDGIGDAFADGWGAFVGAVFAIGFVLAITAPFLLTVLAVLAVAWLTGRTWTRRRDAIREARRMAADRAGDDGESASTPPPPVARDQHSATQPNPPTSTNPASTSSVAIDTIAADTITDSTVLDDGESSSPEE